MGLNKVTSKAYRTLKYVNDAKALERAVKTKSLEPILKRIFNRLIGRFLVRRLWWR